MGMAAIVAGFCWCLHFDHGWGAAGLFMLGLTVAASGITVNTGKETDDA
jgi:hypothetical protein